MSLCIYQIHYLHLIYYIIILLLTGGCKHAFAFMIWAHKRSDEPSKTDVTCYWKKSVLSGVGTNQKFILATELTNKRSRLENPPDNSLLLQDVINKLNETQVEVQLSKYTVELTERKVYGLSLHQIFHEFSSEKQRTPDNFMIFAKTKLSDSLCEEAEHQTRQQSKCLLWFELRYGRITASKLHEAAKCRTADGYLIKQIIGTAKVYDSLCMKRGRDLEDYVFKKLEEKGYKIQKCGFMLIPSHPILGASPDGIADDFIVEIKCPISQKTVKNYVHEGTITPKYKAQMCLQMLAAGKKKALFCLADWEFEKNGKISTYWLQYDEVFLNSLIKDATTFWKQNIYSILIKAGS